MEANAKTVTDYREEILYDIEKYIEQVNQITDIIIARDINQSIISR